MLQSPQSIENTRHIYTADGIVNFDVITKDKRCKYFMTMLWCSYIIILGELLLSFFFVNYISLNMTLRSAKILQNSDTAWRSTSG